MSMSLVFIEHGLRILQSSCNSYQFDGFDDLQPEQQEEPVRLEQIGCGFHISVYCNLSPTYSLHNPTSVPVIVLKRDWKLFGS